MAEPVAPVFENGDLNRQIILGAGNTGAMPLPIYRWTNQYCTFAVSRWKLSEAELEEVNRTGCVYALVLGEGHPAIQVQGRMLMEDGEPLLPNDSDPLEKLAKR